MKVKKLLSLNLLVIIKILVMSDVSSNPIAVAYLSPTHIVS